MDVSTALGELEAAGLSLMPESAIAFRSADGRRVLRGTTRRVPTPSDIRDDLEQLHPDERVLYVVDRLTPSLRAAAMRDPRLIFVDLSTGDAWMDARAPHMDRPERSPVPKRGRRPFGQLAVTRALLLGGRFRRQQDLAELLGLTQSAVSQALVRLGDGVVRTAGGFEAADRALLLRIADEEYPGAGGITTHWWHDGDLETQARMVGAQDGVVLSGDLAARRISAWRKPERVTTYAPTGLDAATLGFARADAADHTLSITVPADRTLFTTARAFGIEPGLADPLIAAHDVERTGSTGDQQEAAERIRALIMRGSWHPHGAGRDGGA
ncbi:hypothetical protein ITJ44_08045 [Clavibacter sp. VKM Ac-2873]|uniref:hypothetical protein n=1 Tax=Clavibacter sp. VKM Ac-2873 TaxID=2783813 RepID=UPI00188D965D|nr:hypothetical protein [Clavibacter sp. VKM Ac-2873]MBF4618022.1 hypothetical protein [Clavibacter sp. VKM Ac-2873]